MRDGHRPDGVGQLLLLQWDAFDDSALPHCRDSLVQARVLRKLLRLKRKHRLIARGIEVGDELLRIGLLQLVDITYVDQSLLTCEGHGVASRYDIGPQRRLAVEGVGIEREITVLREALAKASALELVDALPNGLDTQVGELGGRLSEGEKQRIGLARMFLRDADLVLFDEPTSRLDAYNESVILGSVNNLAEQGSTVVLVSHRDSTMRVADRILRM